MSLGAEMPPMPEHAELDPGLTLQRDGSRVEVTFRRGSPGQEFLKTICGHILRTPEDAIIASYEDGMRHAGVYHIRPEKPEGEYGSSTIYVFYPEDIVKLTHIEPPLPFPDAEPPASLASVTTIY